MADRGVQSLASVWFTAGQPIRPVGELYQAIFDGPAASTQSVATANISMAMGSDGQTAVRLQLSPGRVDLVLLPQSSPDGPTISLLPDVDLAITQLKGRFEKASHIIGQVLRLALVANIAHPVNSAAAANTLIRDKLGLKIPFADATDLIFQVNRHGPLSTVPDCEMNRIVKWTAEAIQQITFTAGSPFAPSMTSTDVATLMVDVNTVPTGRTFQADQQITIFDELTAEVKRLCADGTFTALT